MQSQAAITEVKSEQDLEAIRALFREYAAGLAGHICVLDLEGRELPGLPGQYARPGGRLFLARMSGDLAGCIALRPKAPGIGEVKRLFVRPPFRGTGLGRQLLEKLLAEARIAGYRMLALDTLPSMTSALHLYAALGFRVVQERGPGEPLDLELVL